MALLTPPNVALGTNPSGLFSVWACGMFTPAAWRVMRVSWSCCSGAASSVHCSTDPDTSRIVEGERMRLPFNTSDFDASVYELGIQPQLELPPGTAHPCCFSHQ